MNAVNVSLASVPPLSGLRQCESRAYDVSECGEVDMNLICGQLPSCFEEEYVRDCQRTQCKDGLHVLHIPLLSLA
jgi:hypothetical protein